MKKSKFLIQNLTIVTKKAKLSVILHPSNSNNKFPLLLLDEIY